MSFFRWAIKATYMLQLYAANFLYSGPVILELHQVFPILVVQILLFPKFNRPLAPTSEN